MAIHIYFLPHRFIIICILLSAYYIITNSTPAKTQCLKHQKSLLLQLKNDLPFDPLEATKLSHWNRTGDCCSWAGVECDGKGRVISLQLDGEGIFGGINDSSPLFSLEYLQKLNLAYNYFSGTRIPRGIRNLTHLTHLNLSYSSFGGQIPAELSVMWSLVSLDISTDDPYQSDDPLKLEHSDLKLLLKNLTGLRELYLDSVHISAKGSEWGNVLSSYSPGLWELSLKYCNLSGPLDPSLLQLHFLSVLLLDGNNLSTVVPDFLGNFSRLTTLSLTGCSLKGSFPERVFQVPTLEHLDLSGNELLCGNIPQFHQIQSFKTLVISHTNFSGTLPDSINNLTMLSEIDLHNCKFSGPIPPTLANLTELIRVDLSTNNFNGSIPPFYMSKKLSYIYLSHNSLTGSLSSEQFEGLTNLVEIRLEYNSLSGSIPQSLFLLPSLRTLVLSNNQFSGKVNEFSAPHSSPIDYLDLRSNRLEGPIPESFFKLERLAQLSLSYNNFNGTVRLQRLQNLVTIELSYNNLSIVDASSANSSSSNSFPNLEYLSLASCNLYNFPNLIKGSNIGSLDLSNNRITGEIPSWIWEIGNGELNYLNLSYNLLVGMQKPYNFHYTLGVLDLSSNQLRGELPIPPTYAFYVDYSNNKFDKTIPLDIGEFISALIFLSIANNSLTGPIPTSLCSGTKLLLLDLSDNKLTGNLPPCLVYYMELGVLSLARNNISGEIPDTFSFNCSLHTLDLSNNNLRGKIPLSLSNCKSLQVLKVGNNNLDDSFPCMQLSSILHVLVLRSNRFHGEVTGCHRNWTNLQIIDIASNNFSGRLYPRIFSSWRAMMLDDHARSTINQLRFDFLNLDGNYPDNVRLIIKGIEMQLSKIMTYLTSIDFSCNNFQGEIPDTVGNLSSLYSLNLSHNSLTENIPRSLGKLKQLGSLDLSVNQLRGGIPVELAGLTFLSFLNLSYNDLVGKIPTESQFQTFSASSFEGNVGLCGFPVNISCSRNEHVSPPPTLLDRATKIDGDYVSAALGFVVGLGSILWLLWGCQSIRLKFCDLVDGVVEKIYELRDRRTRHRRRVLLRDQVRRH